MRRVVNDVLDFSKLQAKKFEMENIDFDVRKALGNICGKSDASQSFLRAWVSV